jgi:co-chaperonin GroES (HSP10)
VTPIPFRPAYNRIVVLRDAAPKKIGSIHVPDTVQDTLLKKSTRGVVVAVGPGRFRQKKVKHDPWPNGDGWKCARCGVESADAIDGQLCPVMALTNERVPLHVSVGDVVYFHQESARADLVELEFGGGTYSVMWDDEVMAIEEPADRAAE